MVSPWLAGRGTTLLSRRRTPTMFVLGFHLPGNGLCFDLSTMVTLPPIFNPNIRPAPSTVAFLSLRPTKLPLLGALHYPQFSAEFRPIPKGLCLPAQGCRVREATLGAVLELVSTPTGLRPAHDDATPLGLRPSPRGFPRVARRSQPWALSRNPFGIHSLVTQKLWVMQSLWEGAGVRVSLI
jgi:hypothetical protein